MNKDDPESASAEAVTRRRTITLVVAIIVVIVIAGATFAAFALNGGGFNGANRRAPGSTIAAPSPTSTASATPPASAPPDAAPSPPATIDPRFGAPVAQTVQKDATADLGDTVSARITKIASTTATGTQAGEVSGPAARVELSITNGTADDISLDGVSVNAYYGSGMTPASPIASQSDTGFSGTLAASKTATGSYLFSVPKDQQASLVITVSRAAGAPIVVFQG